MWSLFLFLISPHLTLFLNEQLQWRQGFVSLKCTNNVFRQWIVYFMSSCRRRVHFPRWPKPSMEPPLSNWFRIFGVERRYLFLPRYFSVVLVWSPPDKEYWWSLEGLCGYRCVSTSDCRATGEPWLCLGHGGKFSFVVHGLGSCVPAYHRQMAQQRFTKLWSTSKLVLCLTGLL